VRPGVVTTAATDAALDRARGVRLMAFDVDGVLTDGALYLTDGGEEMKGFHTLDGLGLKLLAGAGIELALITGRSSRVVAQRAAELGIARLFQGADDKLAVLERLRGELGFAMSACGYMGDDLPDLPLLVRCGFAATVPDAPEAVRARAHYVSRRPGGRGAVREVCEVILAARGALDGAIGGYLA
jgi:3-deoxy-D-manno-octulosonate 8-phosphate phosphatase (KDO 8-P phosphatase)